MGEALSRITAAQPVPPTWVVVVIGVAAAVVVAHRTTWPLVRPVVTVVHEGAHALVALLAGRSVRGVKLHRDSSGVTASFGAGSGPGLVATLAAGYPAPSLLGVGAAALAATGRSLAVLWLLLIALVVLLLAIRNLHGLLVVGLCVLALVALTRWASGQTQTASAYALIWFLLFAGPRTVFELHRHRRGGAEPGSDADQLARLTFLPAGGWVFCFAAIDLGAAVLGSAILLGRV
ncbi:M50 family metallopeptidase [Dermacoccaceae bacterium W4C1]